MSVVETMVMASIGLVILGATLGLLSSGSRMGRASQTSVALQNALILQEIIAQDMRQLGVDPERPEILLVSPRSLSFYKAVFETRSIALRPVKYDLVATPAGNRRLRRTEVSPRGQQVTHADAILRSLRFAVFADQTFGGRYLQASLDVLDGDVSPKESTSLLAARSARLDLLARIPVPSQISNRALAPSRRLVPEGPLLPLTP